MKGVYQILLMVLFSGLSTFSLGQGNTSLDNVLGRAISEAHWRFDASIPQDFKFQIQVTEQDSSRTVLVVTKDGNEFVGRLVKESTTEVTIRTESYGELTFLKANIKRMEDVNSGNIREGILWKEHMQSTRYFWQPNGYGLRKGEAYYQNVWVFFNQFSVGVTDNILFGGGIMPLFLLGGAPTPVWITPKVSIPVVKDKVNLGIGGLFATILGEEDLNLGIAYGSATFGPRNRNFTFGVGYGYAGGDWASRPTFSANFLTRVGSRGYFIIENYIIDINPQYGVLSIIGGRSILGNNGAGLDYGLVIPLFPDMGTFIAFPWLGITIPLGPKR